MREILQILNNILLHLYAAISTGEADDQLELFTGILHKLPFECLLFSVVCPPESLYDIHTAVEPSTQCNKFPSHGLPDLRIKEEKLQADFKEVDGDDNDDDGDFI